MSTKELLLIHLLSNCEELLKNLAEEMEKMDSRIKGIETKLDDKENNGNNGQ